MKSRGLLADGGVMSTETLTAPEETTAVDMASEPAEATGETEAGWGRSAPAGAEAEAPAEVEAAASTAEAGERDSGKSAEPSVKDELAAQFEAEAAAEAAAQAAAAPPSRVVRLLTLPLRLVVGVFVLLDIPFAFLGAGAKRMLGAVAIITALTAAATWIGGPRLATTLAAQAREKPAVVKEEKETGEQAPAKHGETSAAKHEGKPAAKQH